MSSKRIVIVGGVAGGASAAARARRLSEEAEIIVLERGPHVSFANCGLPYYIGGEIREEGALVLQTPESLRARFNLDVRVRSEVLNIDREGKRVKVRELTSGREYEEEYDALVLAPGAAPIKPPLPGIEGKVILRCATSLMWNASPSGLKKVLHGMRLLSEGAISASKWPSNFTGAGFGSLWLKPCRS